MPHPMLSSVNPPAFGARLRIGILLPSQNVVAEGELMAMLPEGVSLHTTRLKLTGSSAEDLRAMADGAAAGAELLAHARVDLIVFHCTAVTTFDADLEPRIRERIEAHSGITATTTAEGLVAGFAALKADKAVLVTPYEKAINDREVAYLARFGVSVLREQGLNLSDGAKFAQVDPGEWYRLAKANHDHDAQAYLLSCTAIRTLTIIEMLERDLGAPVLTSNQAMMWHALRMGGVKDQFPGFGRLLLSH